MMTADRTGVGRRRRGLDRGRMVTKNVTLEYAAGRSWKADVREMQKHKAK
jgi:hypothetical protein